MFFGLLNARILLGALRSHLELQGLSYPSDLSRLRLAEPARSGDDAAPDGLPLAGPDIYEWAKQSELAVARAIDSLGPRAPESLPSDPGLSSLELLGPGGVLIDDKTSKARTVVLLDDAHRLAGPQRKALLDYLLTVRTRATVWYAERYEALSSEEMLSLGARDDRDVVPVDLEDYWRGSRANRFQKLALNVADRRTALAPDAPVSSFAATLEGPDDRSYTQLLDGLEKRLRQASEARDEFAPWIESRLEPHGTARERAIGLRTLEIQIQRELEGAQLAFDVWIRDEAALDQLDQRRDAASIRQAAELFLARDFSIPYYFGPERVAQLASGNLDQFLRFAGDLFEEIAGAAITRQPRSLSPQRQEQLIERAVRKMWDRLPRSVEHGREVQAMLDGLGHFAHDATSRPTAPYAPGVTGVGIRLSDRQTLHEAVARQPDTAAGRLASLLTAALAENLLYGHVTSAKNRQWLVLYLNRALCVRYRLPLGYGGWLPVSLSNLLQWSQRGAPAAQPELISG
jgi:hypothetical protein